MMRSIKIFASILLFAFMVVGYQNCEDKENKGTETGDPSFHLYLSGFEPPSAWHNLFIPRAFAAVGNVEMCIHQIRFKANNQDDDSGENANFEIGYVQLDPTGTDLGAIDVAPGFYRRIDIMVKDDCDIGASLDIVNDNGNFKTDKPKILRFVGDVRIDADTNSVELNLVPFISFFDTVTDDAELENGTQNVESDFDEDDDGADDDENEGED